MPLLTEDQQKQLLETLATMGVQPEDEDPNAIQTWMLGYLREAGTIPAQAKREDKSEEKVETKTKMEQDVAAVAAVARSMSTPLRLPTFSGEDGAKGEASFDIWKYEVECLLKEEQHSEDAIRQAIRKSVKGEAARIVKRQGTEAGTEELLDKLDAVFGTVGAGQAILAEFYAAKQAAGESVASWSCRLENLMDKALELHAVNPLETDEMLRSVFWLGLQPNFREASRHKYETIKDFNRLRREVRMIEHEYLMDGQREDKSQKSVKTVKMAAAAKETEDEPPSAKEFKELKGLVHQLTNTLKEMQTFQKQQQESLSGSQSGQGNANKGPRKQNQGSVPQQKGKAEGATGPQASGSTNQQGCWNCGETDHRKYQCPLLPECFKCHRRGHVQKYCKLNGK